MDEPLRGLDEKTRAKTIDYILKKTEGKTLIFVTHEEKMCIRDSYCAIPGIRGPLHSRDMADCVAEARWLAGEGVKGLIVVAQDPTDDGEDWGKPGSICELLDKLNKVPGLEWIRIMYAYPERITDGRTINPYSKWTIHPYIIITIYKQSENSLLVSSQLPS